MDIAEIEQVIADRVAALTLDQKVRLLTGADAWALPAEPAIGLRSVVTSDGPAGVRGVEWDERSTSVNIPSATALAATWDRELIARVGALLAAEARRKGVDVLLAPTVNLHRSPYGGRHFECFSEDPLLSGEIGVAYTRGVQGGGVAVTVKHFVANDSETDRFTLDVDVDERPLRELYLAPFEAICAAGAWAVMAAYNGVGGVTMTESPLLRDVLKDEWRWDGVVMSDWFATRSAVGAGNAALDLEMPGHPKSPWGDALVAAVNDGSVSAQAVDDKVTRVLRLAARVGALDGIPAARPLAAVMTDEEASELVRETAARSFVLARNVDGALPLDAAALSRVAFVGPNAAVARTLGGGSATVHPPYTVSPLAGIRDALGPDVDVVHALGARSVVRLAPAAGPLAVNPVTGDGGVHLRFLDAEDNEVGSQDRSTGRLLFMGGFGPDVDASRVASIEMSTTVTVGTDAGAGDYIVGVGGAGAVTVTAHGDEIISGDLGFDPDSDPVTLLVNPPVKTARLQLEPGSRTPLVLRFVPDSVAPIVAVSLDVEPPARSDEDLLAEAVSLAANSDVAVVLVGTTEEVESEGLDRANLSLPGMQDELVRRVAAVNPRTVVVVNSGSPVLMPWLADVGAVLLTWFPGQEMGNALADVLLGRREAGGRLPTTWPAAEDALLPSTTPVDGRLRYDEGLFVGYRRFDRAGVAPAFEFGSGLGYTTWAYAELSAPETVDPAVDVRVAVTVTNTGPRDGREVVQVYLSKPESAVERPVRWLAGFAAVDVAVGASAVVDVVIPARAFQDWDVAEHAWVTEEGAYIVEAGHSSRDLALKRSVSVLALDDAEGNDE